MALKPYYVLGIDAGATKTTAAVANTEKILGYGNSGAANVHSVAPDQLVKHITTAIQQALKHAKLPTRILFKQVVIGMAGIDSQVDATIAKRLLRRAVARNGSTLMLVNDVHIVLRSGSTQPYGLALICGTGAHGFGVSPSGKTIHVGGLEYLVSDEGSAYAMGNKAIRAALQSEDGRTKPTMLHKKICQHFKVKTIRELEPLLYHSAVIPKATIGQLSLIVDQAARTGDWRAQAIVTETLAEILSYVQAMVTKLNLKQTKFDLVLVGGMFKLTANHFQHQLNLGIKQIAPHAKMIIPKQPPVVGAVRLAWDHLNRRAVR